jgi:hypothetical protein
VEGQLEAVVDRLLSFVESHGWKAGLLLILGILAYRWDGRLPFGKR